MPAIALTMSTRILPRLPWLHTASGRRHRLAPCYFGNHSASVEKEGLGVFLQSGDCRKQQANHFVYPTLSGVLCLSLKSGSLGLLLGEPLFLLLRCQEKHSIKARKTQCQSAAAAGLTEDLSSCGATWPIASGAPCAGRSCCGACDLLLLKMYGLPAIFAGRQHRTPYHPWGKSDGRRIAAVRLQPSTTDGLKVICCHHGCSSGQAVKSCNPQEALTWHPVVRKCVTGRKQQVEFCCQFPRKRSMPQRLMKMGARGKINGGNSTVKRQSPAVQLQIKYGQSPLNRF